MNSKRFQTLAIAVLGFVFLSAALAGTASAKPKQQTVYPVKITVTTKPAVLPADSPYRTIPGIDGYPVIALYGQVTSSKPACKRNRPIISYNQPDWATAPEKDNHTGIVTDSTGRWEGEPIPDMGFTESIRTGKERVWVEVPRKRIGKDKFCRAAKARLKA